MLSAIKKFLTDLYTGPDGETWALGRIYSIPILLTGLAAPILSIYRSTSQVDLSQVGVVLGATAAAIAAIVSITNNVDNPVPPPK
jgi:hypothetical protein